MPTIGELEDFKNAISHITDYKQALELEEKYSPQNDEPQVQINSTFYNNNEKQTPIYNYYKSTYKIVSTVGYLIGVSRTAFENSDNPAMQHQIFLRLDEDKNCRIVRNLCSVRTCYEKHYSKIYKTIQYTTSNIDTIPDLVDSYAIKTLYNDGIILSKNHHDIRQYIKEINLLINSRLGNVRKYFPEWLSWDYIKDFFIMPNGTTDAGAKNAFEQFTVNWNYYPYQCYCNWNWQVLPEEERELGYMGLWSDSKFVPLLYRMHGSEFTMLSLLREASDKTLLDLTSFVEDSESVLVVVDCENSNPVKLCSVLGTLSEESKNKIQKVIFFDSAYTTDGWRILSESTENITNNKCINNSSKDNLDDNFDWRLPELISGLKIERVQVDRLIETKSQVDMELAIETVKAVMKNSIDSVILVSSDSDYWTLIKSLPETRFMVMFEKEKTSLKIEKALQNEAIQYTYMDNFNSEVAYQLRNMTIKNYIQNYIDKHLRFNADLLLEQAIFNSWIDFSDEEKKTFTEKYLKKAHVELKNGEFRILLGEK
ncbi:NYN domain-containing protein [Butyrivibrio fibrisolvens]|uniref:NYN domain-containing protein n=1 Tax=Butyrivibrio fibrisolvens TaxID=831 RepID=UPI0003B6EEF5|nr:NYN domain-containing protein [Butyrivibrio fibrisolvens]